MGSDDRMCKGGRSKVGVIRRRVESRESEKR